MAAVIFVLGLCLASALADDHSGTYNDIESAYNHVFSGYNKKILPKPEPDAAVNVSLDFTVIQLHEVDADEGELSVVIWLGQSWNDPRLHWEKEHYHGTHVLAVPAEDIWIPDIAVVNSVKAPEDLFHAKAIVECNGDVKYYPALRVDTTCPMNEKSDNVTCTFLLSSWVHKHTHIDIHHTAATHLEVSKLYTNPDWSAEYLGAEKTYNEYPCCPGKYPTITFSVRFTKN